MFMKVCAKCGKNKPLEEYNKRAASKDGLFARCKQCLQISQSAYRALPKTRKRIKKYLQGWYQVNRKKVLNRGWEFKINQKFGISVEEYNSLLLQQNGVCAICLAPDLRGRRLAVDHCHKTGKIRGLLCRACNQVLGIFNDQSERFNRASQYLQKVG